MASVITAAALALGAAGCGGGGDAKPAAESGTQGAVSQAPQRAATTPSRTGPTGASAVAALNDDATCDAEAGETLIPAVEIPAARSDDVVVPDQTLAGQRVPGFTVAGVDLPAQRVPAQCSVVAPAPAGCLGRAAIPAVEIPAVEIPAATIPGVTVAGQTAATQTAAAQTAAAQSGAAQSAAEQCRIETRPGDVSPSVVRTSLVRTSLVRTSLVRTSLTRPSLCVDGDCLPAVSVPAVSVPAVSVPAVSIAAATLEARRLPGTPSRCVDVLRGKDATAYGLCSDVLFAFDRATLRPRATKVLEKVAAAIGDDDGTIRVEGHTDSRGGDGYNDALSQRRAEAVRRWLIENGGFPASRVEARGLGEAAPAASNATGAGRAKNRRVVIGVGS